MCAEAVIFTNKWGRMFEKILVLRYNKKVVCCGFPHENAGFSWENDERAATGMNRKVAALWPVISGDQSANRTTGLMRRRKKRNGHARQRVHEFKQEEKTWPTRRSVSS